MLRQNFGQKQRRLQDEVLILGSHIESALLTSIEALRENDIDKTNFLLADDRTISRKCAAIEAAVMALFVTQQPMAGDLRFLAAALEVARELKSISYHLKEIAEINLKLGPGIFLLKPFVNIIYMAELVHNMLQKGLEAFARQDVPLAQYIPAQDDEVDDLYTHIYRQLLVILETDVSSVDQIIYLSQVAHNLERIADRVINICEWVVFTVTGEMTEMGTSEA